MAALSTMRQLIQRLGPEPANDMDIPSTFMTLDDLEADLERKRQRVKSAQGELESRLADFHDAEKAFVERVGPQLTHHVIIEKTQEEGDE